jgi:hypothetical protein
MSQIIYPFKCGQTRGYQKRLYLFSIPLIANITSLWCQLCDSPNFVIHFLQWQLHPCSTVVKRNVQQGSMPDRVWSSDQLACIPLCQIAYCWICKPTSPCFQCDDHILSSHGSHCLFKCSINNCAVCSLMKKCVFFVPGRLPDTFILDASTTIM